MEFTAEHRQIQQKNLGGIEWEEWKISRNPDPHYKPDKNYFP